MDFRMDYGEWSKNSRAIYNKWDAVSRTTTQVLSQIQFSEFNLVHPNLLPNRLC